MMRSALAAIFQIWLICPIWASRDLAQHGSHSREARSRSAATKATKGAGFSLWLPEWWAPEDRDWEELDITKTSEIEYYGQGMEDKVALDGYFYGRDNLFYLEMGALDGVKFSNTLSWQRFRKSRGLLIEANPAAYKALVKNRPHDICVNAAICDTFQMVHFAAPDNNFPVGAIVEFMAPSFQERWFGDAKVIADAKLVACLPFAQIMGKVGVRHVDFWSLDVEGAELLVLKSVDWKKFSSDVIVVEADGHDKVKDQNVIDLLEANGYIFDGFLGSNNWFHHTNFNPSTQPGVKLPAK